MSAVAFDSLEYAHQLEAVGMPREQAEVVAKGVTRMFIHNFDTLVTKDYLESRFAASDAAIQARFADFRLEMQREFEKIHGEFKAVNAEAGDLRSTLKLHSWMLALLMGGIFIPLVQSVLG
ncbi:MAG: DUF1640 domain-containing protein [Pseudomonadales bacterium]|nr:DUF1640 domain-containing protein [Pseudomonadales bacterium]MCP5188081.1 DUF1640 domain-containing protein [Pseudomonadales bacterium]